MTERAYEQVRVAYKPGYSDGVPGARFVDGLSVNLLYRYQAERLVTLLGPPARVVELGAPPAHPEVLRGGGDLQPTHAPAGASSPSAPAGDPLPAPARRRQRP